MFQQCLQERKDERVLYKNLWCHCKQVPLVINNEWEGTLSFVIGWWCHLQKRWSGGFFRRQGLAMSKKSGKMFKSIQSIFIWNSWRFCDVYTNIFQQKSTCICITGDLYRKLSWNITVTCFHIPFILKLILWWLPRFVMPLCLCHCHPCWHVGPPFS